MSPPNSCEKMTEFLLIRFLLTRLLGTEKLLGFR